MVAIYVRVSTQEQAREGYSIGEQTERLKTYCAAMNWNEYRVYTDAGFSGANTNRPALQEMLRDIRAGIINRVLVYKLDRLSRSQRDTLSLIEDDFIPNKCDFTSLNENFDTSTPFGRAAIGILAVFAQLEREQIKERMQMGADARAKEGKWHGGVTPFGYKYNGGVLEIVPEEAEIIREIFEMYAAGIGSKMIASSLNNRGISHRGYKWNDTSVTRLLTNKTVIGELRRCGKWIPGNQNAAVSADLYDRANKILAARRKAVFERNTRPGKATAILTGYLFCAQCGQRYAKWISGRYSYYRCRGRTACRNKTYPIHVLDEIILGEIAKIKTGDVTPAAAPDPGYQKELQKVRGRISRLLDLYADGVDVPGMKDKIEALSAQAVELEKRLSEPNNALNNADAVELVKSFGDVVKTRDFGELRFLVESLIDHIVIDGENIDIFWNIE
jgi:site-specific DNA recombinase